MGHEGANKKYLLSPGIGYHPNGRSFCLITLLLTW